MITKPSVVDAPSPNCWLPDSSRRVEAIVWHITQGSDSLGWLRSPTSEVSSNYLIARDGTIYELVEPRRGSAWGNGPIKEPNLANPVIAGWVQVGANPNRRTVSIEHEGLSSNNHGGSLMTEQVDATIRLTAWLCQEFRLPADQMHVLGHYEINDVDKHYCPGFSASEWESWIGQVAALVAGQATPPAPAEEPGNPAAWHAVETDKWVLEPLLSYWKANGGLAEFGYPITGLFAEGELKVQYFERARLEVHPDGTITRGRVGAELAERLGLVA